MYVINNYLSVDVINKECYIVEAAQQNTSPTWKCSLFCGDHGRFILFFHLDVIAYYISCAQMDPESDRQISDHVLRMHRFRASGEQDGDGELSLCGLDF